MTQPYTATAESHESSMLSRKFGQEIVNYFSGSPLNRVSFLRSNTAFLRAALPRSKFLLLRDLEPLAASKTTLAWVGYETVRALVGNPFDTEEEEFLRGYDSRVEIPTLVFLGMNEEGTGGGGGGESFEFEGEGGKYVGGPCFALDVTEKGSLKEECEKVQEEAVKGAEGREFRKVRLDLSLVPSDAAILAQARSLLDWNNRNQFCSACGARTVSVHAGTKRICPPSDRAFQKDPEDPPFERPPCISRKGIHNIAFPRTDPTVIMAIINSTGDKVLLGRQRRWPKDFYSTLAGFCEPAESVEDAVRRETWEESGVRVGRVVIHSTQPWPYPANLMMGAIGEALPGGEDIVLKHDPELEDAQWVEVGRVRSALQGSTGTPDVEVEGAVEGQLRLPPSTAIAHQLLLAVVNGFHLAKL
ncbi:NUDIX hydrolase domain-like protein [Tuber indicum]|nr:NUDIX hydrolase domain-like protein [Tuber indicum]